MVKRPSEDTEVPATWKHQLTVNGPTNGWTNWSFQTYCWQTWDLLRLMYYGFKNLCADFTSAHPGYTIYPVCLNGGAVETFFSQVKHATSGQLSLLNYAIVRGAVITRGSVHDKLRHHRGDYRNAPLFIWKHDLKRKPYNWKK